MKVSFIHVLDQPLNKRRLASELSDALARAELHQLYIAVAAAGCSVGSCRELTL